MNCSASYETSFAESRAWLETFFILLLELWMGSAPIHFTSFWVIFFFTDAALVPKTSPKQLELSRPVTMLQSADSLITWKFRTMDFDPFLYCAPI